MPVKTVAEIKQMESVVMQARAEAKDQLLKSAKDITNQLYELGFDFDFVEKTAPKKIGRPRKEAQNGKAVG